MRIYHLSDLVNFLIGFFGIILGIVSISLINSDNIIWEIIGIITSLVAIFLIVAILFTFIRRSLPCNTPFKIIEYHKYLTISDNEGKHAEIKKKYKIQYLDPKIRQYLFRSISAPGPVTNFKSNMKIIKIGRYAGNHAITVEIPKDKKKFDIFNVELLYEVSDTFLEKDTEYTVIKIERITKNAIVEINLPSDKPCKRVRAIECAGAGETILENNPPIRNFDGRYIKWTKKKNMKLKVGRDIRIEWDW